MKTLYSDFERIYFLTTAVDICAFHKTWHIAMINIMLSDNLTYNKMKLLGHGLIFTADGFLIFLEHVWIILSVGRAIWLNVTVVRCQTLEPSSSMVNQYLIHRFSHFTVKLTLPPCTPRTAKVNRVDGFELPCIGNCANAAACPSIGWLTFLSTEYNCMAPTTRFC